MSGVCSDINCCSLLKVFLGPVDPSANLAAVETMPLPILHSNGNTTLNEPSRPQETACSSSSDFGLCGLLCFSLARSGWIGGHSSARRTCPPSSSTARPTSGFLTRTETVTVTLLRSRASKSSLGHAAMLRIVREVSWSL